MKRRGFTLVELLVVITIIIIMAGVAWGALAAARNAGRESATKATIAKLHHIVMERYESYATRRVATELPPSIAALPPTDPARIAFENNWRIPANAARKRLDAIRDIMRMEMPDCRTDITNGPIDTFAWGSVPQPALHRLYQSNPPTATHDPAQCLFAFVSMGCPEAMEQFSQSEIGMVDGHRVFVDGWGMPIKWIRWAPGYTSPIQSGDATADHDPFDTRKIDTFAFRMIPLIYSATGKRKADGTPQYGIDLLLSSPYTGDPYHYADLGKIIGGEGGEGIITNHNMEQR